MKKRNAITVASIASIGFGTAAAAAVGSRDASASASSTNADAEVVQKTADVRPPTKPKVVTVYIDEASAPTAAASNGATVGAGRHSRHTTNARLAPTATEHERSTTPTANPSQGRMHRDPSAGGATDHGHDAGGSDGGGTTVAPPTTVPPVNTTTGPSGSTGGSTGGDDGGLDDHGTHGDN